MSLVVRNKRDGIPLSEAKRKLLENYLNGNARSTVCVAPPFPSTLCIK